MTDKDFDDIAFMQMDWLFSLHFWNNLIFKSDQFSVADPGFSAVAWSTNLIVNFSEKLNEIRQICVCSLEETPTKSANDTCCHSSHG